LRVFRNSVEKIQHSLKSEKDNVYLTWSPICISVHFLLERDMLQNKIVEKIKTHILCSKTFFHDRAVCEKMLTDTVQPGWPQMTIWCKRFACWITEITNTHSEYVLPIAFPRQNWLPESAPISRFTFIACIVYYSTLSLSCFNCLIYPYVRNYYINSVNFEHNPFFHSNP